MRLACGMLLEMVFDFSASPLSMCGRGEEGAVFDLQKQHWMHTGIFLSNAISVLQGDKTCINAGFLQYNDFSASQCTAYREVTAGE